MVIIIRKNGFVAKFSVGPFRQERLRKTFDSRGGNSAGFRTKYFAERKPVRPCITYSGSLHLRILIFILFCQDGKVVKNANNKLQ